MTYITSRITSSRIDDEVRGDTFIQAMEPGTSIVGDIKLRMVDNKVVGYTQLRVGTVNYTNSLSTLEIYQTDDM